MKYLKSHQLFINIFITAIIFIWIIPAAANAAVIRLNLYYDNGIIRWDKMASESIQYFPDLNFVKSEFGDYRGSIVSFRGIVLDDFKLNLVPTICSDGVTKDGQMTGGCVPVSKGIAAINIPYYNNGNLFKIFDKTGKMIFVADLTAFASCNENMICEANLKENQDNCSSDCLSSLGTVATPSVLPTSGGGMNWFLWTSIILGVLILIIITYFIIKKYRQNSSQ
jgi:hypothetical protein